MKTYLVQIVQTTVYENKIEAKSYKEACEKANDIELNDSNFIEWPIADYTTAYEVMED